MPRIESLLILIAIFVQVASGQGTVRRILEKPAKYQHVVDEKNISLSKERVSTLAWVVFSDRSDNVTFSDSTMSYVLCRLGFFEWYYVIEERENVVHLVKDTAANALTLSKSAKDCGWIEKNKMLLWERCLVAEPGDIPKRAVLSDGRSISPAQKSKDVEYLAFRTGPSGSYGLAKDRAGADDFYFVLKSEDSYFLMSKSARVSIDIAGRASDSSIAGWIPKSQIVQWSSRFALEPNWDPEARQERAIGNRSMLFASVDAAVKYKSGLELTPTDIWWSDDSLKERPVGAWRRFPIVRSVPSAPGVVEVMAHPSSRNVHNRPMKAYAPLTIKGQRFPLFRRVLLLDRSELYECVNVIETLVAILNTRYALVAELRTLLRTRNCVVSESDILGSTINRVFELLFGFSSPTRRLGGIRIEELRNPLMFRQQDMEDYMQYLAAKTKRLRQISDMQDGAYQFAFRSNGLPYYWIEEELIP